MKFLETRVYRGPNLYGYRPIIRLTVDLEVLEDYPSNKIENFVDRLIEYLPSLEEHTCSYGEKGGFIRRLREGTWMGHILEHCAIELQCLVGTPVTYGKCRGTGEHGVYYVIYSYDEERVGLEAGNIALAMLRSLFPPEFPGAGEDFHFEEELVRLTRMAEDLALGPSTRSLVKEAKSRGIPALRLNDRSLIQFGHGIHQKRIEATVTSETRHIAVEIAQDKELTNKLLEDSGIPVPKSILVRNEQDALDAAERIGYPCVIKPYNLSHGRGITLNLQKKAQVKKAFERAYDLTSYILVENHLSGRDHRVLVVDGEVVAVAERVPGHVVGDGTHTIGELVDRVNKDPRRGVGHEKVLTKIKIDYQAKRLLKQADKTIDSVLSKDEIFYLRSTGNLSTGGTAVDKTDQIHPENSEIAKRAAKIVGLDVAGIDFITEDISRPAREMGGGIVEVNAAPGFRMHVAPTEGKPRNVAKPVMDMLFPKNSKARIPIFAITGTNGKTTVTRMVAHILKMSGKKVGFTTTDGIYIDGERYLKGDMTGPWSARVVLRDPTVEAAVLETARGGILREGLGFDRCNVGCVLNVTSDHLGSRGIETIEDLAYVKRLILEVVQENGHSVLNADDPLVVKMRPEAEGKIVYFSMNPQNEIVQAHVKEGGLAAVLEDGVNGKMLTLYRGEQQIPLLWSHLIPATVEGKAMFNVQNALAASAIAFAARISLETIRQGLRTFDNTFFQAPGRCNVFDQHPFRVIVDYGHNAAAIKAMTALVNSLQKGHTIGVIAAPGDRRDQDIKAIGKAAAKTFDQLIIKEDDHRRGRKPGEVAALLQKGAISSGQSADSIKIILSEEDAVQFALKQAKQDDLLVLFADDIAAVWKQVIYFGKSLPV